LAIWLNSVLKAVELPTGVTNLDTGLANVNADDFTHLDLFFISNVKVLKRKRKLNLNALM